MSRPAPKPDATDPVPEGPRRRALADRYFATAGPVRSSEGGQIALRLHSILMAACFEAPEEKASLAPARRASISEDGTPIFYSFKIGGPQEVDAMRIVGEPGGYFVTTDEQILRARRCAQDMCAAIGWTDARADLEGALDHLLPGDPSATRNWWGGVWVGFDVSRSSALIKTYVNLRPNDVDERWAMIARLFRAMDGDAAPVRRAASLHAATPMGACLAVTAGRLAGLRLYLGLDQGRPEEASQLAGRFVPAAEGPGLRFCRAFQDAFGKFQRNSIVIGVDFAARQLDGLSTRPRRAKIELCAELLPVEARKRAWAWLEQQAWGGGARTVGGRCPASLAASFGGHLAKYVTLGVSDHGEAHWTYYAHPIGARLRHGIGWEDQI